MSWWFPQFNRRGDIASGNGEIFLNGAPLPQRTPGLSPQWFGDTDDRLAFIGDAARLVDMQTGALVASWPFLFNPRVGNTSGICAGAGHWCGWNPQQGLIYDGRSIDPGAAPGAVDRQTGALYYLTPYQANWRNVVLNGTVIRNALATEIVAGYECATWGEYEQVRTIWGWAPETGAIRLNPMAPTEHCFTGIPVNTPEGRWLVTLTALGVIVYPWGSGDGYILEGEFYYHDACFLNGVIAIAATNSRGELVRVDQSLDAPRTDLADYHPTTGEPPDPPDPPDPPEDEMKPPIVTVDAWTLDDVLDGREIVFHDAGNPDLGITARVWVQNGSMYASFTNKAGHAQTGATRTVHPCSEDPDPPDPPDPPTERQQVGFGSNLGAVDLTQLATSGAWKYGRDRISMMQLYVGHVSDIGADFVEPNGWPATADLVKKLREWGILLELQAGYGENVDDVTDFVTTIADAGGALGAICFDHGFQETSPEDWATRLHDIHACYPSLIVGAYVPFPFKSVAQIRARVQAWANLNALPAFLRLDCDYNQRDTYTAAVHKELRALCDAAGLGYQCTINAQEHISDLEWVRQGKAWFDRAMTLGRWDAMMVQSWASTPSDTERKLPHNLPESEPSAHTNLLRYVLEGFPNVDPPDPPPEQPDKFSLRRHDVSKFVSLGGDKFLVQLASPATFEEVPQPDGTLGLKTGGKYCAAESDYRVKADRDSVSQDEGSWEKWTKVTVSTDPFQLAYRAWNGLYLSCHDDGSVRADQPAIGGWETLNVAPATTSTVHGRLRIDGRMLRDDVDYYRPVWSDCLAGLTRDYESFMDWAVATGFNGLRVFGGDVTWAGQTPRAALDHLPGFLQCAWDRGLRVEFSALTGTKDGHYDPRSYIAEAAAICNSFDNAILEMANEPWHPSQAGLTPQFLMSCLPSVPSAVICALGAAQSDESSEYAGGPYITSHLDRGRDEWNMVRRVRELEALSVENGKPVFNNEPIKAGSQNNNPAIFFTFGVLNRGFEVPGVYHSDDGLQGVVPTPHSQQQVLAESFIRGSRVITTAQRMTYKNAGWHDSPVKSFSGCVRVYSFMADQSVSVALGIEGHLSIEMQNGWSLGPVLDEMPGVKVYQLAQSRSVGYSGKR